MKTRILASTPSVAAKRACLLVLGLALASPSCVSVLKPEQAPVVLQGKTVSPVGVAVTDHRTGTSGVQKDRYYGRCRLSYGIPTPINDPAMTVAERLTKQLEAGLRGQKTEARTTTAAAFANAGQVVPSLAAAGASKVLIVRLNDVWIDFANPIGGRESVLYFNADAQVLDKTGRVLANGSRKLEKNFRYDVNDSFFNQAVWTLQPEFSALVNQPALRRALAP